MEEFLQAANICFIGNIDGNVIRERIDVLFIGNGHIHDLTPHQAGLGMLGPGKLIEGQVDFKAHIPDFRATALWPTLKGSKVPG